jgi:large subunit ribosomal protein L13
MKTWIAKPEEVKKAWWIVDATDLTLGRLATEVANVLRGKHKPTFTPNVDCGDFVVVINSNKIRLTGRKDIQKKYYSHTRFFGSLKEKTAAQMLQDDSTFVITEAVRGMLPTNRLNRHVLKKLKVYTDANHEHAAQKPQPMTIKH